MPKSAEPVEPVELVDYVDGADLPVRTGPRGGASAEGLLYRVAATLLTDARGGVLVYRRPAAARVLPGHHDVLVGGSVRAGEGAAEAARRELAEEFGVRPYPGQGPRPLWRERVEGPAGPCWLTVHHARLPRQDVPRGDPEEIAWHGFLPLVQLLGEARPRPFNDVGLRALRRFAAAPQEPRDRPAGGRGPGETRDGDKRHT